MFQSAIRRWVPGILLIQAPLLSLAEAADQRKAWRFTQGGKTVTIVEIKEKVWETQRPDGRKPTYEEVQRTDEFVEIIKRDTGFQLRLFDNKSQFRKQDDQQWKRWWNGKWVAVDTPAEPKPQVRRNHEIRLVYFVPADRKPVTRYEDRIHVVMSFVANFFLNDLQAKGFTTRGLQFESRGGKTVVHLIQGKRRANYYNHSPQFSALEQWKRLAPEIKEVTGNPHESVVAVFAETQNRGSSPAKWPGNLARGAYYSPDGGRAVFGAVSLRNEYCKTNIKDQMTLLRHMNSQLAKITVQRYGAIAHELGHAFGLGHDLRRDSQYIMGNGFRNLVWNLQQNGRVRLSDENATLLMSSRYFASDLDLNDNKPPKVELQLTRQNSGIVATVHASDESKLRAVVFVDKKRGSVLSGGPLSTNTVEIRQELPKSILRSGSPEIMVTITDNGGNRTQATATGFQ